MTTDDKEALARRAETAIDALANTAFERLRSERQKWDWNSRSGWDKAKAAFDRISGLQAEHRRVIDTFGWGHPATLGYIEHGMLPAAWESVLPGERVAVEVLHTHEYDTVLRRCMPAFAVRVLVWDGTTWSAHWQADRVYRDRAEALVLCLEAAAERREP